MQPEEINFVIYGIERMVGCHADKIAMQPEAIDFLIYGIEIMVWSLLVAKQPEEINVRSGEINFMIGIERLVGCLADNLAMQPEDRW